MTEIHLLSGKVALVDDEDYAAVSKFTWVESPRRTVSYAYAYAGGGRANQRHISLHRLILDPPPRVPVDHINGNGLDCRRSNLRIVNNSQNLRRQRKTRPSTSQYKGVRFHKNAWQAFITVNRQFVHLGTFRSEANAAQAYNLAADEYFGEFARGNEVAP